ncbi:serine/threonine protein phosphatase 5 [Kipferlia bialata]|uniref:Serine/threonine-protein phosphatase n=1 Tax=Kipferlia bialata TaxID=797122 RepID=A0A9K3CMY4_9EUKA|nr:serine/threonine protein phosphatase 5 [Kipferlia bialata]|eukprot:g724.t1
MGNSFSRCPFTTEQLAAREAKFFAKPKLPPRPSDEEIAALRQELATGDFLGVIDRRMDMLYVTSSVGSSKESLPTVMMKPVIHAPLVESILRVGTYLLSQEPNVVRVTSPEHTGKLHTSIRRRLSTTSVPMIDFADLPAPGPLPGTVIVGDTHGTYEAVRQILRREGLPKEGKRTYVFNGDYVDRGSFSTEVYIVILALKVMTPNCVYMLRGNHETKEIAESYTFLQELRYKYDLETGSRLFDMFVESFRWLSLVAVIDKAVCVLHGGLSGRPGCDLAMIDRMNRCRDPEKTPGRRIEFFDPLQDILWSDPAHRGPTRFNLLRGASVLFNSDTVEEFLAKDDLSILIRSHSCVPNGFEESHKGLTYTLFSVPSYQDVSPAAYVTMVRPPAPKASSKSTPVPPIPTASAETDTPDVGEPADASQEAPVPSPDAPPSYMPIGVVQHFACIPNVAIVNQPCVVMAITGMLVQPPQEAVDRYASEEDEIFSLSMSQADLLAELDMAMGTEGADDISSQIRGDESSPASPGDGGYEFGCAKGDGGLMDGIVEEDPHQDEVVETDIEDEPVSSVVSEAMEAITERVESMSIKA